jgi:hypothetical protein
MLFGEGLVIYEHAEQGGGPRRGSRRGSRNGKEEGQWMA